MSILKGSVMNLKTNFSEDHILTIYLEGDIDSATAAEAEVRIMDIYQSHDAKAVVLAYEKGETIYLSMASRCFSDNSNLYHAKTIIGKSEYIYLAIIVAIIILLELLVLFYSGNLAYLGVSLSL